MIIPRAAVRFLFLVGVIVAVSACHRRIYTPAQEEFKQRAAWTNPVKSTSDKSVRFFVLGDWGMGNEGQRRVARSLERLKQTEKFHFGITVGDNFYEDGVESIHDPQWETKYEALYGNLKLPMFASLGNHDWGQDASPQWHYRGRSGTWNMPAPYYEFSVEEVHFFALDTSRWDEDQADWLTQRLSSSRARWVVVYGHHPVYSYGSHKENRKLLARLNPLLLGRVDFYLTGHDHDKQIIEKETKPVYVISGAGAETRPTGSGPGTVFSRSTLGVLGVSFQRDEATLRFFDDEGRVEFEKRYPSRKKMISRPIRRDHIRANP